MQRVVVIAAIASIEIYLSRRIIYIPYSFPGIPSFSTARFYSARVDSLSTATLMVVDR